MTGATRRVYIVSDLHLGGAQAAAGERGFQICTQTAAFAELIDRLAARNPDNGGEELVIAGDFVDFLAESDGTGENGDPVWKALREDDAVAEQLLHTVAMRSPDVFAALRRFSARGHTLTILLGNHDIELCYPRVRQALKHLLGVPSHVGLRFIYDGEAYAVGDALIEHGNRYDGWNAIDYDALRRVCSLKSRGQAIPPSLRFPAPAGSQLVAEVMNPVKRSHPFIDLLKPENTAALPLLLALEPGARSQIAKLAKLAISAGELRLSKPALPTRSGDISAHVPNVRGPQPDGGLGFRTPMSDGEAELLAMLGESLGEAEVSPFLSQIGGAPSTPRDMAFVTRGGERGDIAARPRGTDPAPGRDSKWSGGLSWAKLLLTGGGAPESRLKALHKALRAFCDPSLFAIDKSPKGEPLFEAAKELARISPFRYIVMGHTHLARNLPLDGGGRYLNSGTWADLMRVPDEVFADDPQVSAAALQQLVADMADRRYDRLIVRRPTYVRLELAGDQVVEASVETYQSGAPL